MPIENACCGRCSTGVTETPMKGDRVSGVWRQSERASTPGGDRRGMDEVFLFPCFVRCVILFADAVAAPLSTTKSTMGGNEHKIVCAHGPDNGRSSWGLRRLDGHEWMVSVFRVWYL